MAFERAKRDRPAFLTRTLHFSLPILGWMLLTLFSFRWVLPSAATTEISRQEGRVPSIILISVDTLRADRLSSYGYQRLRTPHIDRIATGGTLFSAVDSQVPLTLPSHVSLFTSTYPFSNGIEDNGEELRPNAVTLATVLRSRGYRTAAFVGGFVLDRRFGLNQGFDFYDSPFDLHKERGTDPGDIKRLGADVVSAATEWLDNNSRQPFFVFLHLYDLHTPYNLPAAYRARFGRGYDAELRYVDEQLGRFWEFLSQRRLLDHTMVVLTSDHGESLGEHGEETHGYFIYQSTLWVPLIIHWPAGLEKYPARIDTPVNLMDVAPTILQFSNVQQPPQFQGRSLVELLRGAPTKAAREVYSESLYAHNHFGCTALWSLRVGRYKYIEAPKPEFYDLSNDSKETKNLYSQKRSLALASRERLLSLRARFRHERPGGGKGLDPEEVARLSSLGYVAFSSSRSAPLESGADPKDRIRAFEDYGRGIILGAAGRAGESNSLLERLLAEYPDLVDPRMTLGLNNQRLGRHEEAAKEFRQVLKSDPLNTQAHFDLGLSFFELRRLDDATKELQAALAIAPNYTRAEELLGTVWLQKGDYLRARVNFNHILKVDPNDFAAHYNLGALDTMEGQWDTAEMHLNMALQVDPQDSDVHNTLGSLYLRKGDLEKSGAEFREAIRLRPKLAWAHYNLGLVLRQQKKDDEALSEFRQALGADPGFRPAREALERGAAQRKEGELK